MVKARRMKHKSELIDSSTSKSVIPITHYFPNKSTSNSILTETINPNQITNSVPRTHPTISDNSAWSKELASSPSNRLQALQPSPKKLSSRSPVKMLTPIRASEPLSIPQSSNKKRVTNAFPSRTNQSGSVSSKKQVTFADQRPNRPLTRSSSKLGSSTLSTSHLRVNQSPSSTPTTSRRQTKGKGLSKEKEMIATDYSLVTPRPSSPIQDIIPSSPLTELDEDEVPLPSPKRSPSSPLPTSTEQSPEAPPMCNAVADTSSSLSDEELEDVFSLLAQVNKHIEPDNTTLASGSNKKRKKVTKNNDVGRRQQPTRKSFITPEVLAAAAAVSRPPSAYSMEAMLKAFKASKAKSEDERIIRIREQYEALGGEKMEIPDELPDLYRAPSLARVSSSTDLFAGTGGKDTVLSAEDVQKLGTVSNTGVGAVEQANLTQIFMAEVEKKTKLEEDRARRTVFVQALSDTAPILVVDHQVLGLHSLLDEMEGLSEDDKELLKDVVEELEYGWTRPNSFPVDIIPTSQTPHSLVQVVLFRTLAHPACPVELGHKCVRLLASPVTSLDWKNKLRSSFAALGVKPEYLGEPVEVNQPMHAHFKQTIHTLQRLLIVTENLVKTGALVEPEWLFPLTLRLAIDPHCSTLSRPVTTLLTTLLTTTTNPASHLEQTVMIAKDLGNWKTRANFLRLLPTRTEFKKWAAIAVLDLCSANPGGSVKDAISYIIKKSKTFTISPPPRELLNILTSAHVKYSDPPISSTNTLRTPFSTYLPEINATTIYDEEISGSIEILEISLNGLWDYLINSNHSKEIKTKFGNSFNLWIQELITGLRELNTSIRAGGRDNDRVILKNLLMRVIMVIEFLNKESALEVKNIDRTGQMKLDRFVVRSSMNERKE
ncbi:hypothetical protein CROQUDRAFT_651489 [Cronartium quercuum f. sp. fusiforme G11]|uniref:Uncharacterized protein n=1 Tax=Cronartium quercuum f. sp. fusiforme G11 TaxID=708437 RepID=A0A9P6NVQ1_9BASI|nr:hypothetical protein CROQUDRAFT_651489 [Cronartium quercuum f. sp. fusiforme G11]